MIKNLTGGALISYGTTYPSPTEAYDGALFYKSTGIDQGLYIFSFNADSNEVVIGEQVTQGWNAVVSPSLYVSKAGDTMTGDLVIQSNGAYKGLRLLNTTTTSGGSIGVPAGAAQGLVISGDAGPLTFQAGGVTRMVLQTSGNLQLVTSAGTANVWTNLNDGAGSGLDADLFDGQDTSYFLNATNINAGTLNIARFPFVPVQQGGGTGQLNNKIFIGWNNTQLMLQVDSTNYAATWPINISGTASNAAQAANANTAGFATDSQSAQYVRARGSATGSNMIFRPDVAGGNPLHIWGSNDNGANQYLWTPASITVGNATNAATATTAGQLRSGQTGTPMTFHYAGQPGAPAWLWVAMMATTSTSTTRRP